MPVSSSQVWLITSSREGKRLRPDFFACRLWMRASGLRHTSHAEDTATHGSWACEQGVSTARPSTAATSFELATGLMPWLGLLLLGHAMCSS